jgi:acyl-CoA-binding protein
LLDDYAIQKQATEGKYDINKKAVFKMLSHHEIIDKIKKKETALKQTFERTSFTASI